MIVSKKNVVRLLLTGSTLALFGAVVSCSSEEMVDGTRLSADEVAYNGNIRLSLSHPFDVAKDDYELLFAVPTATESVALCEVKAGSPCQAGSADYFETELVYATPTKRFYRAEASAILENGLTLKIMARDGAGKVTDSRVIEFVQVGAPTTAATTPTTTPTTTPGTGATVPPTGTTPPTGGAVTEAEVQGIVRLSCDKAGCHSTQYGSNLASLKAAGGAGRIESGNMPKDGPMSAGDKAKVLQFLK